MSGTVYLVGAGTGHPDLITLRGLGCLRRAQVVVYDRLVSRSLLAEAGPDCELIYAGKHGGGPHAMTQEEISQLLVDRALAGKTVCRLKGGDPFVFGRGGEEAHWLQKHGIPYEVVPGVTAGVGASAYAGIPVTHRGVATGVTFVTGHEAAQGSSGVHWAGLAASSMTLVCYMGLSRLSQVRDQLLRHGKPPDTPAAVIHWGSRAEQQVVTATLAELPEKARGLPQPALVVIGKVADLRETLFWAERRPLFGHRVLVAAGSPEVGEAAAERLRDLGAEPWVFPRRSGGPHPGELELLRQELSEGGIHLVLVTDQGAAGVLADSLGAAALGDLPVAFLTPEATAAARTLGIGTPGLAWPQGDDALSMVESLLCSAST